MTFWTSRRRRNCSKRPLQHPLLTPLEDIVWTETGRRVAAPLATNPKKTAAVFWPRFRSRITVFSQGWSPKNGTCFLDLVSRICWDRRRRCGDGVTSCTNACRKKRYPFTAIWMTLSSTCSRRRLVAVSPRQLDSRSLSQKFFMGGRGDTRSTTWDSVALKHMYPAIC